jgi:glycosyltransferase involved in cell wall biosynthesis
MIIENKKSKIKIAIDITRAIVENAGISRFTREIAKSIVKIDPQDQFVLVSTHFRESEEKNQRLQEFIAQNVKIKRIKLPGNFKELAWGWSWAWYESFLNNADVLLAPSFFEVNLGFNLPQVVVIHDMVSFLFPEQRGAEVSARHNKRVKYVCAKAKKIIAVSQSTKNDLVRLLKIQPSKIKVVHPGQTEFPDGGQLPLNLKSKNYVLFVGTLEPRKNLRKLVQAYALLSEELRQQFPLIIVGAKGWMEIDELEEIRETKGVRWLGYVSEADLGELYRNAAIFAYCPVYEGFGLPVIEAEQFGVPVLTSNVSSLPEAVGEGGIQIDPNSINAISKGLQKLLEDKKLREELGLKAKIHAQQFSWAKAAKETLEVLKEVANA